MEPVQVGLGEGESEEHPHSASLTQNRRPLRIHTTCLGGRSYCLDRRFSLGQIRFSFLSPSSICSLIHLSQLQSSPAMKESDPKFYFSPSNAWHLSETNATTEDN